MSENLRAVPATGELCQKLADDLLHGADAIAEFVFGNVRHRRKVYYLATAAKIRRLPVFRMGSVLCARKSKLIEWIEQQEAKQ
jgi:hypothetical protein